MENSGSATLKTLLSIKQRRERSIQSELAALGQQETALLDEKARLTDERARIWRSWRECGASEGIVDRLKLEEMKLALADHCQRDQQVADRLDTLQSEWNQLQLAKAEQQQLLRKVMIEQEKLNMLLE